MIQPRSYRTEIEVCNAERPVCSICIGVVPGGSRIASSNEYDLLHVLYSLRADIVGESLPITIDSLDNLLDVVAFVLVFCLSSCDGDVASDKLVMLR